MLKRKLLVSVLGIFILSIVVIVIFYTMAWRGRGSEFVVSIMQNVLFMPYYEAVSIYQSLFRNYMELYILLAVAMVFAVMFHFMLSRFTPYFDTINEGIEALLDDEEVRLPPELIATDRKLNAVKEKLRQRTLEVQLAEQKKNDLVMYLAHDIRTPLTSVIGYLNLLEDTPDMSAEQREKYLRITLDKAYRLEQMVNEFFDITRFNNRQITIYKEPFDLYYLLVQLTDELSPLLDSKGNSVILHADEELTAYGDPDKLARVFNNVMKNAITYSYPDTPIEIFARDAAEAVILIFRNQGKPIPREKLDVIFERFYRLDDARTSHTGGSGLGLAIAKEIVTLHGGSITAGSAGESIEFRIVLPKVS